EAPHGTFVLDEESDRPMVFVGGGTGFAPLKGQIEHALHEGIERPMTLYWGVRSRRELYLPDLPEKWAAEHPNFRFVPVLSEPDDDWEGRTGFVHEAVVAGRADCVNPDHRGTKAAAHAHALLGAGESFEVWVRFSDRRQEAPFEDFEDVFERRIAEADEFYDAIHRPTLEEDARRVQRQAWAGLIWTEQFYHYSVELWLDGDPAMPEPPPRRKGGRNADWRTHIYNVEILSMPDKWEYPWYAAWDLGFHMVVQAMIDPDFAKGQLKLLLREWYQHPNGQLPAYEWDFGDANPPVHAWAAWRVYQIDRELTGEADTTFLERIFHKLMLNFTWWVNRKDHDDNNVFQGGFLGLDNIGVFDRSKPLPTGGHIDQADGTAWMAMYCLNMMRIALEIARTKPAYEDVATKFFEHFVYISYALSHMGKDTHEDASIWDGRDGFYYDVLHLPNGNVVPLKIRSLVGLVPLFAVETLDQELLDQLPDFRRRMEWFLTYRPHLVENMAPLTRPGVGGRLLFALPDRSKLARVLTRLVDPDEFLSPYGIRSLSKYHEQHPYTFRVDGQTYTVRYEPGESRSGLFGGNSNWRGPVWFPTNYLLIESLRKYDLYYGEGLQIEYPLGSGEKMRLSQIADKISQRMAKLFKKDDAGYRPAHGDTGFYREDPACQDLVLFHEYFHADTGVGLGASHQTGWTALVAKLIQECAGGETCITGE
ncbi:MAG: MGH1-like glycoside hydrolase domain-containing protein, partial [Anaerolineae bacterium]